MHQIQEKQTLGFSKNFDRVQHQGPIEEVKETQLIEVHIEHRAWQEK